MVTHAKSDATAAQSERQAAPMGPTAQLQNAPASPIADSRIAAVTMQRMQDLLDSSPATKQLKQAAGIAAGGPASMRMQHNQHMADASPQAIQPKQQINLTASNPIASSGVPVQREPKPNNTGLPDQLKAGIEALSATSMDHVKVHYNSAKPAALQAHAYAQGSEIHVGPGQERHLPHEAWHVVQQARAIVKPTLAMQGGVPVNDDAGLEAEADMMGARAQQAGAEVPAQRAVLAPDAPRSQAVAQMAVDPEWGDEEVLNSFAWIRSHPRNLLHGAWGDIWGWIETAERSNQIITDAEAVVEDDEEQELLEVLDGNLDYAVTSGNQLVVLFDAATHDQRRGIADQLIQVRHAINEVFRELTFYFRPGGHGFGAVGRATEVDGRSVEAGARGGAVHAADRFINYSSLDGTPMTSTHRVTGGAGHLQEAGPLSLVVNGLPRAANAARTGDMRNAFTDLAPPQVQQKAAADNFFARDRGDGQAAAMANTNARGYAWLHAVPGWNQTRWEWLHLRAAGLSGHTHSTNLVLGTRDANTQMMPYESNMRALQNIAAEYGNYTGVDATWTSVGGNLAHAPDHILMEWSVPRTQKGIDADVPAIAGRVYISPRSVGEVLSKAEVRHIEAALHTVRNAANPDDYDMGS